LATNGFPPFKLGGIAEQIVILGHEVTDFGQGETHVFNKWLVLRGNNTLRLTILFAAFFAFVLLGPTTGHELEVITYLLRNN